MPRSGEFKRGGAQPKEELVDDRLHPARPARLHPHPNGFARCLGLARRRRTARRKHLQRRVIDAGMLERRKIAILDLLVVYDSPHGFDRRQCGQTVDVFGRTAESGSIEQMLRACAIPIRRLDRIKIVHPIVLRSHRHAPEIRRRPATKLRRDLYGVSARSALPSEPRQAPARAVAPQSGYRTQVDRFDQCGPMCFSHRQLLPCFLRGAVV